MDNNNNDTNYVDYVNRVNHVKHNNIFINHPHICSFAVFVFFMLFIIFSQRILGWSITTGPSMQPTFQTGDVIKYQYVSDDTTLLIGDIIGIKKNNSFDPGISLCKRIVALPGDYVSFNNGYLYVNGKKSPYNFNSLNEEYILYTNIKLKDDEYYILGDNRNFSYDSSEFGPVKRSDINKCNIHKLFNMDVFGLISKYVDKN